ncbi:hypothetical protein [Flavobacterium pedocola]
MKKTFCLFVLLTTLISCNKNTPESKPISAQKTKIEKKEKFEAVTYQNDAILLTDTIKIYDSQQNVIREITNVYGKVVTIDSISKNKFDLTNSGERCNLHNFVKVTGPNISGWVYGRFLFEKENQKRDKTLNIDTVKFQIIPTKNFNIGVYDEETEGLSFCGENQNPVLFYNGLYNKYEYLPLYPKNENYDENYLTLDAHDGWMDEIKNYSLKENVLTPEIYREYQEGSATITVEIELNKKQSTCKVTKIEKRDGSVEE